MELFILCLNGLCLMVPCALHIFFISRLTGKAGKFRHFALYFIMICILEWIVGKLSLCFICAVTGQLVILCTVSHFALKNQWIMSWSAAICACYISQLSFGIVNSVESLFFPRLIGTPILYILILLAVFVSFFICAICYTVILRSISLKDAEQISGSGLTAFPVFLSPVLFFYSAQLYILQTSYTYTQMIYNDSTFTDSIADIGKHTALLFLQILGLGGLLCTLYAYQRICRSFQIQTALIALSEASRTQKKYVSEAQIRFERTKAFRHDIKNHLTVLNGLLDQENTKKAKTYLKTLETASDSLSFPYQTGNPVVDILLGEKLSLAKSDGISAHVSLILPRPCQIDDFDLCVIFANALDNAADACRFAAGRKELCITGRQQGDFYMLEFKNTCPAGPLPPSGTGLSNIRAAAEKYHGTMLTEKNGRYFSLNVLLNISIHPDSISIQKS